METNTEILSFEDFKKQNGITYWWASELSTMLGYASLSSFQSVIDRTTKAFISLSISHYDNIIPHQRELDGHSVMDFKLTRFACYLMAMNANPKKPEVAQAQAYFATQARAFEMMMEAGSEEMERLIYREEISESYKSLSSTIKAAGIEDYAKFQNAGYLGMYNMTNWQLSNKRGVDSRKIYDTMGRTELSANLFRQTMTEERIKLQGITGQVRLEQTHRAVGAEVRKMVQQNTGKSPENLPQERELPDIKKELKQGHSVMKKLDKPKAKSKGKKA